MSHPAFRICAVLGIATLAACNDTSVDPGAAQSFDGSTHTVTLDASSQTGFSYLDMDGDSATATTSQSAFNGWDLSMRRFEVRLNGGASGTVGTSAAVISSLGTAMSAADSARILSRTADSASALFAAATSTDIAIHLSGFHTDSLANSIAPYASFGATGPVAAPGMAWKLKLSNGNYGILRVDSLNYDLTSPTNGLKSISATWAIQSGVSGTLGTRMSATGVVMGGKVRLDLASGTFGAALTNYDVEFHDDLSVSLNGASSYPFDLSESFATLTSASTAPAYASFLSSIGGAISADFESPRAPFVYNLKGDHLLSPTFNVYLVNTTHGIYKVQFLNFYSATGVSGVVTLRFARLQ